MSASHITTPVVYIPPPHYATARSSELARVLREAIAEYQRAHPKTSADEISAAVRELSDSVTPQGRASRRVRAALAIVAGLTAAIGAAVLASASERGESAVWPLIAIVGVSALVIGLLLMRLRDE